MTLKHQKDIRLINICGAIYDDDLLKNAITWYSTTHMQQSKKVFLHGNYAAVAIGRDKIHIHRLIGLYLIGVRRCNKHFHHINGNKMDDRAENIACVEPRIHLSRHNKGRKPSTNAIRQTIEANRRRKGCRTRPHRGDVTPKQVYEMRVEGLSFNQISLHFRLDWGCVKQRYEDFIHDNPELLKTE